MAAWSSKDGELAKSTTTCAPSSASARPSPVIVLTPVLGAAASASCPRWVSLLTTFEPMSPVPPITTIFMTSPLRIAPVFVHVIGHMYGSHAQLYGSHAQRRGSHAPT